MSLSDISGIVDNAKELDRLRKEQEEVLVEIDKLHKELQASPDIVEKPDDTSLSKLQTSYIRAKELNENYVDVSNLLLTQLDSLPPSKPTARRGRKLAEGNNRVKKKRMNVNSNGTKLANSVRNQIESYAKLKGEQVAAKISEENAEKDEWIVVKVLNFDEETKLIEVIDEEPEEGCIEKTYKLPMSSILSFLKRENRLNCNEFATNKQVLAVYPGSTELYKAKVISTPRKNKSDEYLLEFDDDEENGELVQRLVHFYEVVALPKGYRN